MAVTCLTLNKSIWKYSDQRLLLSLHHALELCSLPLSASQPLAFVLELSWDFLIFLLSIPRPFEQPATKETYRIKKLIKVKSPLRNEMLKSHFAAKTENVNPKNLSQNKPKLQNCKTENVNALFQDFICMLNNPGLRGHYTFVTKLAHKSLQDKWTVTP